jgi:hypothetical protein
MNIKDGVVVAEHPYVASKSTETWLQDIITAENASNTSIVHPTYDLPSMPTASERQARLATLDILEAWYAGADPLIRSIAGKDSRASAVRCWPHHFDLACLIQVSTEQSIGVGFSPGDGSYQLPYFYVTPWPYPATSLPTLEVGAWHTDGWTGAVLQTKELMGKSDAENLLRTFLRHSVRACLQVLEADLGELNA